MRVCGFDGFALELDLETARRSIEAGWPAVEVYSCRMGHSVRAEAPSGHARSSPQRPVPRCAVCGVVVPPGRRTVCSAACTRVVAAKRREAYARGEAFLLEAAPWYKGSVTAYQEPAPLPPLDPLGGRMPQDWAKGWRRLYGGDYATRSA